MSFFKRKLHPYRVLVWCDGNHPYLRNFHDFPSKYLTVFVDAHSWKDAEKKALLQALETIETWLVSVRSITRL